MDKKELRVYFKDQIHKLKLTDKKNIEDKVLINLKSLLDKKIIGNKLIGLYIPMKDELSINLDVFSDYQVSFAQLAESKMEYKFISSEVVKKLRYNDFFDGVVVVPELVIIPALAYNKKGYRLGRGGGFFDRYLDNYQGVKIGVCGEFQITKFNEFEAHDIPVDYIVTEQNIYKIKEEI